MGICNNHSDSFHSIIPTKSSEFTRCPHEMARLAEGQRHIKVVVSRIRETWRFGDEPTVTPAGGSPQLGSDHAQQHPSRFVHRMQTLPGPRPAGPGAPVGSVRCSVHE